MYNKHYITVDGFGNIISAWSDGPHYMKDTSNAVCITEEGSYQFRLTLGGEENPAIFTEDGIPMYKWDGTQVIKRTDDEIEADRTAASEV